MAWNPPRGDDEYATKRDLQEGLQQLRTELMDFIRQHCATKEDLGHCATKEDLGHCATKADVEHIGRVLAWGLIAGMGVMLAATLAGMWGVVHTLVSLAN